ncbi:MAG: c-type cytochrome [Terriglobales bacterium]
MNYPAWQLGFPGGLLIATVAIVHVFVSHFAVGGGAYLVLTEQRAYARNDDALLAYVRRHSKFFALLTVVFGAVTGVGIWFTIGLVAPESTSSLIHTFVWGWAIEWVFFFVEIAAALIYAYQWDRLDRRTHLIIGWIYFAAAWASLAVINGIITYMLTPGGWLTTHSFWAGIFNPTYFPSLLIRSAMAMGLAGMFGLVTALRDPEAKPRLVRWAGAWLVVGVGLLLPFGWWYDLRLPAFSHDYLAGFIPAVQTVAHAGMWTAGAAILLAVIFALAKPRWMNAGVVALILVCGLATMGSGEYVREVSRKPYSINGYIYANDMRVAEIETITATGAAKVTPWVADAASDPDRYGRQLFAAECASCHSVHGYRAMAVKTRGWDATFAANMLQHLPLIRGTMPPFAGNEQDRVALGRYLASIADAPEKVSAPDLGRHVFERRCAYCHTIGGARRPLPLAGMDADTLETMIGSLPDLTSDMPPFTGTDAERHALAVFLAQAGK